MTKPPIITPEVGVTRLGNPESLSKAITSGYLLSHLYSSEKNADIQL